MNRRDFLLAASAAAGGTAASGAAAAQQGNASGGGGNQTGGNATGGAAGNQTGGNQSAGGGGGSGGGTTKTVTVGPGGSLTFEPQQLTISPGTAVRFVWDSGGHNVVANNGDWGHEPIEDSGFSFTTPPFQETGSHGYVCVPHESAGMVGTIQVGQSGGGGGGAEEPSPEEMGVPFQAHFVGIATILMMIISLIYTFFLVKYGESPNAKGGN